MNSLDAAHYWNMDPMESIEDQIALIWIDLSKKIFPDYKHSPYPLSKKGDPRKTLLFKYCYKLARETQGLIPDEEYSLYITAQMRILKAITNGNLHSHISPQILVGLKAWRRWKLWKKRYDERSNAVVQQEQNTPDAKVKESLLATKEFLTQIGALELEKLREAVINNNLFKWINMGKISPYYLALSKYISQIFPEGIPKEIHFDLPMYKSKISPEAINYFTELFQEDQDNCK